MGLAARVWRGPSNVLVVGSSLSTGVAVQFVSAVKEEAARVEDAGEEDEEGCCGMSASQCAWAPA